MYFTLQTFQAKQFTLYFTKFSYEQFLSVYLRINYLFYCQLHVCVDVSDFFDEYPTTFTAR